MATIVHAVENLAQAVGRLPPLGLAEPPLPAPPIGQRLSDTIADVLREKARQEAQGRAEREPPMSKTESYKLEELMKESSLLKNRISRELVPALDAHRRRGVLKSEHLLHLRCEVPIDFVTAALGGELEVPTLEGRVMLKIPPETQTGKMFRLRGKGVRSVRGGGVGDLICRVAVETPVNLNKEQKELLRQFGDSMTGNTTHSPRATSWLDGVKKFFEEMKFS